MHTYVYVYAICICNVYEGQREKESEKEFVGSTTRPAAVFLCAFVKGLIH